MQSLPAGKTGWALAMDREDESYRSFRKMWSWREAITGKSRDESGNVDSLTDVFSLVER